MDHHCSQSQSRLEGLAKLAGVCTDNRHFRGNGEIAKRVAVIRVLGSSVGCYTNPTELRGLGCLDALKYVRRFG